MIIVDNRLECFVEPEEFAESIASLGRDLRPVFARVPVTSAHFSFSLFGLARTRLAFPNDAGSSDTRRTFRPAIGQQPLVDT